MRVLTSYAWPRPGGMQTRFLRAMRAMVCNGVEVHWITANSDPDVHPDVQIHRPRMGKTDEPNASSGRFWALFTMAGGLQGVRLVFGRKIDTIFSFSLACAVPLLPAAWLSRKPLVVFVRSDEQFEFELKMKKGAMFRCESFLNRRVVARATHLVCVSEALIDQLVYRYGEKVRKKCSVLPNNVPDGALREWAGPSGDRPLRAVSVGRLEARKNTKLLVEALGTCPEGAWRAELVGDGPEREALADRIDALGLAGAVSLLGWQDDTQTILSESDVLVLCSHTEGMPNVVLEALSVGCPCLVSDIPVHRELFPEGRNVFNPDKPEELADLLRRFHAGGEDAQAIQHACMNARKRFSFDWDAKVVEAVREAGRRGEA